MYTSVLNYVPNVLVFKLWICMVADHTYRMGIWVEEPQVIEKRQVALKNIPM